MDVDRQLRALGGYTVEWFATFTLALQPAGKTLTTGPAPPPALTEYTEHILKDIPH